jgi:hypothetical protein
MHEVNCLQAVLTEVFHSLPQSFQANFVIRVADLHHLECDVVSLGE